jgi:hypothetical protein
MHRVLTTETLEGDVAQLLGEVGRYLVAVDEFRSLGCEPVWRSEDVLDKRSVGLVAEHGAEVRIGSR